MSMKSKQQIKEDIAEYHWMIQTIALKRAEFLDDTSQKLTATYGDEAGMPKAQGNHSDPLFFEVVRREKAYKSIKKMEDKVKFIQERMKLVDDPKQVLVLNKMLDGESMRSISRATGIPLTNVRRIRDEIANKIHLSQPAQMAQ